ncbi:MAG: hypothetical protein ACRCYY_18810 [Trueperaceae bacterium]
MNSPLCKATATPWGDGDIRTEDDSSLLDVIFLNGPLSGEYSYGGARYNNHGQHVWLGSLGADKVDFNCYQQEPRVQQALLEWVFKDPQASVYTCVEENTGTSGPTLEILEGRRYRVDGGEGEYSVDITNAPDDGLYSVDYLTGPWSDG